LGPGYIEKSTIVTNVTNNQKDEEKFEEPFNQQAGAIFHIYRLDKSTFKDERTHSLAIKRTLKNLNAPIRWFYGPATDTTSTSLLTPSFWSNMTHSANFNLHPRPS
jgi:hypothetical protein